MKKLFLLIALCVFAVGASAQNYPCSKKKGGINHCEGSAFICNDGSVSASRKNCQSYFGHKHSKSHKAKKHRRHHHHKK